MCLNVPKSLVPLCQSCLLISLNLNGVDSLVFVMLKAQTYQAIWTKVRRQSQETSDYRCRCAILNSCIILMRELRTTIASSLSREIDYQDVPIFGSLPFDSHGSWIAKSRMSIWSNEYICEFLDSVLIMHSNPFFGLW